MAAVFSLVYISYKPFFYRPGIFFVCEIRGVLPGISRGNCLIRFGLLKTFWLARAALGFQLRPPSSESSEMRKYLLSDSKQEAITDK